jgi:hypothetical protein
LMAEVENNTELGKALVDEFISFNTPFELSDTERTKIMALMQLDLDNAPPGWGDDEKIVVDDLGTTMTPNQLFQEVKEGTDFGNRYAQGWLERHELEELRLEFSNQPAYQQLFAKIKDLQQNNGSGGQSN